MFRNALLAAAGCVAIAMPLAHAHDHQKAAGKPDPALVAAVKGDWRSDANRARDPYRHPAESLTFWGLEPGMTVLEVQPGGGAYWTEIVAPYLKATGGSYYATGADLADPELPERWRESRAAWEKRFSDEGTWGSVDVVNWGRKSAPLPADKFDLVIVSRSVHGWMRNEGMVDKAFRDLYAALEPGGILAIEQHRANPGPQDPQAESGYVTEAYVIEQAKKAGFELAASSEINANPKDTKDQPFGVWTLPPIRQSVPMGSKEPPAADFYRAKYDEIGESDRMTLRFGQGA